MLKNYPLGSDITLLNNFYLYPRKNEEDGKWDKGSMNLIYRDNITGRKFNECIEDPDYEYYVSNEPITYNALYIEESKARKISTPFTKLEKSIAEETGNLDFYNNNINNGNRNANKLLHTVHEVFNSDTNIEDHYRFRFDKLYKNSPYTLSKAFFDIEVDTINMRGDFPEMGECPVNAITIICQEEKKFYTFLLRNEKNPQIAEFENSIGPELFQEIRDLVRDTVGGWKNEKRYGLDQYDYQFLFYDEEDEINLIADLFKLINKYQPDFVLAWNMAFDLPYLIERIKVLGYNPEDIICHPDFEKKVASYYVDEFHKNDFEARGDFATISSYSVFMCQMIQFASRRKGQAAFSQFGLNYIGNAIAKVKKLDYSHITTNIAEFPWKDYKLFILYNIVDTIVQLCIENKTGDIDYTFGKSLMNNTRYSKTHRQTVYLTNRGCKEFYADGLIICNNHNRQNDKPKEKFPGAFVANPAKLLPDIMTDVMGSKIPVLRNLDDYDYKSLYPSIMIEFNIAPNTQLGKLIIPDQIWKDENKYNLEHFVRGGKFLDDLQSHDWLQFAQRWFGLADYKTLLKDILEYYDYHYSTKPLMAFTRDGLCNGITFYEQKQEYCANIWFEEDMTKLYNPVQIYHDNRQIHSDINNYYKERGMV